jgi:hypothetical protein
MVGREPAVDAGAFWGRDEKAYSRVLAETLALCSDFRDFFLKKLPELPELADKVVDEGVMRALEGSIGRTSENLAVETEKVLEEFGRVDVWVNFPKTFTLAIENKKRAGLQRDQLHRYDGSLRKTDVPYLLLFLAPSRYDLPESETPNSRAFARLNYKRLHEWVETYITEAELRGRPLTDFERAYFSALEMFIGELEMKPISDKEVSLLGEHDVLEGCLKKLERIVEMVWGEKPGISNRGYIVAGKENVVPGIGLYVGFRYGTRWYYDAELLCGEPEALVYAKDTEADEGKGNRLGDRLKGLENTLRENAFLAGRRIDHYPRTGANQCRLAIRRPLGDFLDKDVEVVAEWLRTTSDLLERLLKQDAS